jgi:hypothetical protein
LVFKLEATILKLSFEKNQALTLLKMFCGASIQMVSFGGRHRKAEENRATGLKQLDCFF